MMNTSTNRRFGIEIEMNGITMEQANTALNAGGIACRMEGYGHSTPTNWKLVTDGSVSNGFELVSPILSGNEGLAQVQKVSEILVAAGAKVDKTCGFHVHVDAQDLNGATLANIVRRYATHESAIDSVMPRSRRGMNNRYCQSMASVVSRLQGAGMAHSAREVANMVYDRYYKLNLCAFVRHGTVEFRQHSGTVEARKMIPWILFCLNFVETSKVVVVREESVPSTGETAKVRKNAIEKKFAIMAQMLDSHDNYSNYVTPSALAEAMGVAESTVQSYISQFRAQYPEARIEARRGRGYYRNCSATLSSMVGVVAPTVTVRAEMPTEQGLFAGLPTEVVSYFQERALDLAA